MDRFSCVFELHASQSDLVNMTIPDSTLKKSQSIVYHFEHWEWIEMSGGQHT